LQLPITGHPLHTRSLTLVVSQRPDGGWHARGDVIDLRKVGFVPMMTDIQPAGIIHQMSIDLEIDRKTHTIESIEVEQPVVAIEPSRLSRGECCRDPAERLRALAGEQIDDGFSKRLSSAFGGPLGCSHLLTLFQLMSSGIARAFVLEAERSSEYGATRVAGERVFRRAVFVDGYEAADRSLELALQLSDFHSRPDALVTDPLERLGGEWDVRAFARIEAAAAAIADLALWDRYRNHTTLATATWSDRSERVCDLIGGAIIPGLARRLFGLLGRDPEDGLLLDAMLQLAPGHIQVLAAIMDRWYAEAGAASVSGRVGGAELPEIGRIGGMQDSCYMWRKDGPLAATRTFGRRVPGEG
jgi:hypothetical protein